MSLSHPGLEDSPAALSGTSFQLVRMTTHKLETCATDSKPRRRFGNPGASLSFPRLPCEQHSRHRLPRLELLEPLAVHLGHVNRPARIDAEHVGQVELAGAAPLLAEAAEALAVEVEHRHPAGL